MIHKIDFVKDLPFDVAHIEIAYAVGGKIGDFDFKLIASWLKNSADRSTEGDAVERGSELVVNDHTRAFTYIT